MKKQQWPPRASVMRQNDTQAHGERIASVQMLLTHSIELALFLLDEGKGVLLFIFHIQYFQSNH